MRLSVAVASSTALPSAFVVFRGFEESIRQAAALGYQGVELALKSVDEVDPVNLDRVLQECSMEVSCISTGQVYADLGLTFSDEDPARRERVVSIFKEFIDVASKYGKLVNIGRIRGSVGSRPKDRVEEFCVRTIRDLCRYALAREVTLALEPVNRYEIDYVNSLQEGAALVDKVDVANFKLMPDLFHMNIEDPDICGGLEKYAQSIGYVHLADSNRLAPGRGHTDFKAIFGTLRKINYQGWLSVEILPKPTPFDAAKQAADFLLPLIHA